MVPTDIPAQQPANRFALPKLPSAGEMTVTLLATAVGIFAASYFHSFSMATGVALIALPHVIQWTCSAIFHSLNPEASVEMRTAAAFGAWILSAVTAWNTLSLIDPQWTLWAAFKQMIVTALYGLPVRWIGGLDQH